MSEFLNPYKFFWYPPGMKKCGYSAPVQSRYQSKANPAVKANNRRTRPFVSRKALRCAALDIHNCFRMKKSVDLIISDLTSLKSIDKADAEALMTSLHFVVKAGGPILLAANGLVGAALIEASTRYKYSIIFEVAPTRTSHQSIGPVQNYLEYLVFYDELHLYRPQKTRGHVLKVVKATTKAKTPSSPDPLTGRINQHTDYGSKSRNPRSVVRIDGKILKGSRSPALRIQYMLRSYSKRGDTLMDIMTVSSAARTACRSCRRNLLGLKRPEKLIAAAHAFKERFTMVQKASKE